MARTKHRQTERVVPAPPWGLVCEVCDAEVVAMRQADGNLFAVPCGHGLVEELR